MYKSYILIKDTLETIVATTNEQGKIATVEVSDNKVGNIDEILKCGNRIEFINNKIDSNKSKLKESQENIKELKKKGIKELILLSIATMTIASFFAFLMLIEYTPLCNVGLIEGLIIGLGGLIITMEALFCVSDIKRCKRQNVAILLEQEHLENELKKSNKEKQLLMNDVSLSKNAEIEYNKPIEIDNENNLKPITKYRELIEFYMKKKNLIMKWSRSGKLYDKLKEELDEDSLLQIREWVSDEMDNAKKGRVKKAK